MEQRLGQFSQVEVCDKVTQLFGIFFRKEYVALR
jgi:hypothetical protein